VKEKLRDRQAMMKNGGVHLPKNAQLANPCVELSLKKIARSMQMGTDCSSGTLGFEDSGSGQGDEVWSTGGIFGTQFSLCVCVCACACIHMCAFMCAWKHFV